MKKFITNVMSAAILVCGLNSFAEEEPQKKAKQAKVAVYVKSKDGASFSTLSGKNMKVLNPHWVKENKEQQVVAFSLPDMLTSAWQKFEFTFTPNKDGKFEITFSSRDGSVGIDTISGQNVTITNGSFEKFNSKGKLTNWTKQKPDEIVENAKEAQSGERFITTRTNKNYIGRVLEGKAGKAITIALYAKKFEPITF